MTDPGFPVGGGAKPPGGANIRFCQILRKLHEIEKTLGHGGAAPPRFATKLGMTKGLFKFGKVYYLT